MRLIKLLLKNLQPGTDVGIEREFMYRLKLPHGLERAFNLGFLVTEFGTLATDYNRIAYKKINEAVL